MEYVIIAGLILWVLSLQTQVYVLQMQINCLKLGKNAFGEVTKRDC